MELGYRTDYDVACSRAVLTDQCFPYRRVNGQWPYLAGGIDRETDVSIIGSAGRLEKNGVTVRHQPGRMTCLLTEPRPGAFSFWMQWPNERRFEAVVPGDVRVTVDGRLALQKLVVDPGRARIDVDNAPYLQTDRRGEPIQDRATAILVFGMAEPPTFILHGTPYDGPVHTVTIDGETAHVAPLFGDPPDAVRQRLQSR